jgi:hypothetical protein
MKKLNQVFNWKLAVISVGVLALSGGGYWWYSQKQASSDVQYRTSKIERGSLQASVSASGAVNPVTQVSVGTQVSGQIKELYVDFNSEVKVEYVTTYVPGRMYYIKGRPYLNGHPYVRGHGNGNGHYKAKHFKRHHDRDDRWDRHDGRHDEGRRGGRNH